MSHKTGIIVLRVDNRRAVIKERPVRIALIGELPPGYEPFDHIDAADEMERFVNASALYVGLGRWGTWLYWRRRSARNSERWLVVRDVRAEHVRAENMSLLLDRIEGGLA